MAKAAVAKKAVVKKPVAKASKPAPKKPALKVVKTTKKPVPAAKTTKPVVLKDVKAAKPAVKPKAKAAEKGEFRVGHHVVYPTHGVGKIVAEETQMIGDISLRMFVIAFDKDRMTLRVPMHRATSAGLRHVSGLEQMQKVFVTLKSKPKISRGMWSRRAQEYEAKINSGNVLSIAEVVRDLHHNVDQAERSYSERIIYESALNRLVGELAAAEGTDHKVANDKLLKLLRSKTAVAVAA